MTERPPEAIVEPAQRSTSWLWVLPALAALAVVAILAFEVGRSRGPMVRIAFADAAGLEIGADLVHRGIRVGVVRDVRLAPDLSGVIVDAELAPHAGGLAREGAAFWVVQPEISLQRVAGLDTLIGPRYIAVRPGDPDAESQRSFEGLPGPPLSEQDRAGLTVRIDMPNRGSVSAGTPVLYRGIAVGSVRSVELAPDASRVIATVSIDAPHTRLVRANTRWWATGGVGVDFGLFRGLSVQTGSLEELIDGAVNFATPNRPGDPVEQNHVFTLAGEADSNWLEWDPSFPPEDAAAENLGR